MSRRELSPEQQEVVETFGQGLAVLAGAGSGKTTTLVEKCRRLLELNPESRFAAVSFTERSAGDLRAKLAEALAESGRDLSRHWVMTIHGLCAAVIGDFPGEAGFDGDEMMLSEPEARALWDRAVRALWEDGIAEALRRSVDGLLEREGREGLAALLARLRSLASFGAIGRLLEAEDADTRALGQAAEYALGRYMRLKHRRGAMDFDDLERGADRALEHEHVRRAYHERFALVLVDEFQDTNPVQARLIRKFARPDASNLCVVGDPKQSIYRFRDADVGVFEEFCAKLPRNLKLSWNFRSRPGVIEYANGICAEAFAESELAFDALVPKREPDPAFAPVERLEVKGPDEFAAWVRAEQGRGVPLERMALLLRRIRGAERWLKALSHAGISIAIGSGGLFWEDPRVREVVALLKAWSLPGHRLSAVTFLRAAWVGLSDDAIDRLVFAPEVGAGGGSSAGAAAGPRVRNASPLDAFLLTEHRLAARLRPLRGVLARPGEILLALLDEDAVERELGAQLLGLWHRVEELTLRGLDFREVADELARAVTEKRRERDVPPPMGEGARGQLAVLTLHGSKGLEFDHVCLVDFGRKARAQDMPMLFWDREKGAYLGTRNAEGDRDRDSPVESAWRAEESRKQLAESKRLFYVALTRARERLVLVAPEIDPPAKAPVNPKGESSAYGADDWRAWIDAYGGAVAAAVVRSAGDEGHANGEDRARAAHDIAPSDGPAPAASTSLDADLPLFSHAWAQLQAPARSSASAEPRRPRHSVTEWTLLSRCPRAYEWRFIRPRVGVAAEEPARAAELRPQNADAGAGDDRGLPGDRDASPPALDSRELGSRVHACLERGDYESLARLEEEAGPGRLDAAELSAWAQASPWMQPANSAQGREVWSELAFEARVGGEALVGSIDRLIREESPDGSPARLTILDFKVSSSARSRDEAALVEAYQTQLDLYAWAARALDPAAEVGESALVVISGSGVQAVAVRTREGIAERLAEEAARIVAGTEAEPRPGSLCRYCEFRYRCPESAV